MGVSASPQASQGPPGTLRSAPAVAQAGSRQASSSPVASSVSGAECAPSQTQLAEKFEPVHAQSEKGTAHVESGSCAHA